MDSILKTARRSKGLTQAQVAVAIGRDQSTISKYEAGEARPDTGIAPAYAVLLGLTVLEVLYPGRVDQLCADQPAQAVA